MITTTLLDENRTDYCIKLVNNGFVHVGTMWGHYDIYYDEECDYTCEVGIPNDNEEYEVCEYPGTHRRTTFEPELVTKLIFDPLCKHFYIMDGEGWCSDKDDSCIIKNANDFLAGCSYRKEKL